MSRPNKLTFILIHGAWHGAWCWGRVTPHLMAAGHDVIARDLPGHGLNAVFPETYFDVDETRGSRLSVAPSPSAGLMLSDYVQAVLAMLDEADQTTGAILVGHSMGGLAITEAAERCPDKIRALVYLAAFMPPPGESATAYAFSAANEGELVSRSLVAEPAVIGALRLDPLSVSSDYRDQLSRAFYGATDARLALSAMNLLSPDVPASLFNTPISSSGARWGSLPRHYIRCSRDRALRPRLQQRFISDVDAAMSSTTAVHDLNGDHSPFLSAPFDLARMLLSIGERESFIAGVR